MCRTHWTFFVASLLISIGPALSWAAEAAPAAAAVIAPAPAQPTLSYMPPLSLEECQNLIMRAHSLIPAEGAAEKIDPSLAAALASIAQTSANYLHFRSDLHPSFSHYRWIELVGGRVENNIGETDHDIKRFNPPVEGISALSLEARHGDIWLHRILVFDEKDNMRQEFDYSKEPRLLRHALPRRDVYHLWRRTTISRIEIEYARAVPNQQNPTPQVGIFAGLTTRARPEHVKTAIFHLQEAHEQILTGDWETARESLALANERLRDYLRRNRPGRD